MKAIIFTGATGRCAIYGEIDQMPMPDDAIIIRNARMILRVERIGFVGLGSLGPKAGTDTRITRAVPTTTCIARQALQCTPEAAEAIEAWPSWQ